MNFKKRLVINNYVEEIISKDVIKDIITLYESKSYKQQNYIVGDIIYNSENIIIRYDEEEIKIYFIGNSEISLKSHKKILLIDNIVHYTIILI